MIERPPLPGYKGTEKVPVSESSRTAHGTADGVVACATKVSS